MCLPADLAFVNSALHNAQTSCDTCPRCLLKHHVAEWARIDGWGGVGDENLSRILHRVTQGYDVGRGEIGSKKGVTKGCPFLPTVGWQPGESSVRFLRSSGRSAEGVYYPLH